MTWTSRHVSHLRERSPARHTSWPTCTVPWRRLSAINAIICSVLPVPTPKARTSGSSSSVTAHDPTPSDSSTISTCTEGHQQQACKTVAMRTHRGPYRQRGCHHATAAVFHQCAHASPLSQAPQVTGNKAKRKRDSGAGHSDSVRSTSCWHRVVRTQRRHGAAACRPPACCRLAIRVPL